MRLRTALALLLLSLAPLPAAGAPQEAGTSPIEVTADRLSAESGGGSVTFEGNVVAKQGDVTMYSNRLHAEYSRKTGTIERIEAEGSVRFLQEGNEVKAGKATLFNLEQRVVFSGGATMQQGGNTVAHAACASEAIILALQCKFDVILIESGLPDLSNS